MGYDTPDLYYQPEAFDLKVVGSIHDPHAYYSFDDLVVWQHQETGELYWAQDSGCSYPSPFEDYTSLDSANRLTLASWNEFEEAVKSHAQEVVYEPDYSAISGRIDTPTQAAEKTELLAKVLRLL